FRSRIHNQSDHLVFDFRHQYAVLFVVYDFFFSEAFAQVDDGNDLPTQVDHTLHTIGSVGNGGDIRYANDLMHQRDGNPKGLATDAEADDVQILCHVSSA